MHVISPQVRRSLPEVRAHIDFSVLRLRGHFASSANDTGDRGTTTQSAHGKCPPNSKYSLPHRLILLPIAGEDAAQAKRALVHGRYVCSSA